MARWYGWTIILDGLADYNFDSNSYDYHLGREGRMVSSPPYPNDGWGFSRSFRFTGYVHVLRVLGIDSNSDVLPYPQVGWR